MVYIGVPNKPFLFSLLFAGLLAAACWMALRATDRGIGISPDSAAYVDAAVHLRSQKAFNLSLGADAPYALTHFPPLYPAILSLFSHDAASVLAASRALNVALLCLNLALIGLILLRATGSAVAAAAGLAFGLASVPFLMVHVMAWSEPLYTACTLAGFYFLGRHQENGRAAAFAVSIFFLALSPLTRYAGLSLLPVLAIAIWMTSLSASGAVKKMAIALGAVAAPVGLWMARNQSLSGDAANRELIFRPPWGEIVPWIKTLSYNLVPDTPEGIKYRGLFLAACGAVLLGLFLKKVRKNSAFTDLIERATPYLAPGLTYAACYFGFIFLTGTFVENMVPIEARIFVPVYPFLGAAAVVAAYGVHLSLGKTWQKLLWAGFLTGLLFCHAALAWRFVRDASENGRGYAHRMWDASPTLAAAAKLAPDKRVYSNDPRVLYFKLGRNGYFLGQNPYQWLKEGNDVGRLGSVSGEIGRDRAAAVYFFRGSNTRTPPDEKPLTPERAGEWFKGLGERRFMDGIIWENPQTVNGNVSGGGEGAKSRR